MFSLDTALLIIDIRNFIVEIRTTFIVPSDSTLQQRYNRAGADILKFVSAENLLYAYMV